VTGSAKQGLASVDTSSCLQVPFSQPFASFGDLHWYTLAPGQAADAFVGSGWALGGGAGVVTTTLADGTGGSVLDLPAGSSAVSPPMCVASNYPTGRAMIRDLVGSDGVQFAVSYEGTRSWLKPKITGEVHGSSTGWTRSARFGLQPYSYSGWQIVRFRLSVPKDGGEYELYNLYIDPFMRK
jgi:hypothetical protein